MRSFLTAIWRGPVTELRIEPWIRALIAAGYMSAIIAVSSIPGKKVPELMNDKLGHFLAYFFLALLVAAALAGFRTPTSHWVRMVSALLFTCAFGISDEWHQSFVPGRFAGLDDFVADALGASTSIAGLAMLMMRKEDAA